MVDHPPLPYSIGALPERPCPSDAFSDTTLPLSRKEISSLQNLACKSPISTSDSPNGLSAHKAEEEGSSQFKLQEYKFYYHFLYWRRKKLKEARSEYTHSPCPALRDVVHKREQAIVKVFVKLLQMRTLLREAPAYSQEVLDFCFCNPTVSDWLKAVGIQSRFLIDRIKSHFNSIESLLTSERPYLMELVGVDYPIHPIEVELFLSSWEILRASSHLLQGPPSPCHFSWTDCCDRISEFPLNSSLPSEATTLDMPRRVPSPDPWTKPRYTGNLVFPSVSDATSNSDPNIYPLTPSPGPPSSLGRHKFAPSNHTFPRRHKPATPNPETVQPTQVQEIGENCLSEDGDISSSPRSFRGKRLLKRLFRPKILFRRSYANHPPQKGDRNSWILEYPQEPKAIRYKPPLQGSPDTEKGSQSRLQIDNDVFLLDPAPSPSYPSDTGQTDGSCSPLTTSPVPTDWEINFQEIRNIREVRACKYSVLSTGNWHGHILLKTYQGQLTAVREQFHQEVNVLRNIRHDNVILFRGACTALPDLTIVTSVKHSPTLHQVIRQSPKHPLERALHILKEISQAMTYLHDRRIVHQNLTTDSIYLERSNAKPVLFDIAVNPLLEYAGVDAGSWEFPRGYVSCMAPEIAMALSPAQEEMERGLPFSEKSDVYAFGSIWYELYTGLYPLQGDSVEVVLFKASNGVRQTLDMIIGPRGIKDELFRCWNKDPHTRPSFQELEGIIERLPSLHPPKKMPVRSTSHSAILPFKSSEATM